MGEVSCVCAVSMFVLVCFCGLCPTLSEDDLSADAALEAEELDRDIETLEVRLSLAENGIEEASAVLGLKSAATAPGEPEPPKAVKRAWALTSCARSRLAFTLKLLTPTPLSHPSFSVHRSPPPLLHVFLDRIAACSGHHGASGWSDP